MPNLYDRSYNQYTQDGDDCPPHPFSMAYGGNDSEDEERDAWDFVKVPSKKTKRAIEQVDEVFHSYQARERDEFKFIKFFSVQRETEKSWLIRFEDGRETWFPKSLCTLNSNTNKISGPYSFMEMKMRKLGPAPTPVKIGTQLERCPYCGKDTGCDCASPGHKPKVTLIPAPPADLAAQIAKAKLKKFVEENR